MKLMTRNAQAGLVAAAVLGALVGSCGGAKTVKFGAVLPLIGQWQIYGEPIRKRLDLAFEQAKNDPKAEFAYELDVRDSESRAPRAAEQLKAVYDAGAVAVVGGVTSDEALAMVPVMDGAGRVLLSPSASSPKLTGISSNFYRIYPSDFREGAKMGNFAAQTLGLNKAVILAAESNYALGVQDVFKSEFERYGGEVAAVIEYPVGHTEFNDDVKKALSHDPEAVYVADYAFEIASIVKELRQLGFRGRILTTHAFAAPGILSEVGAAAEGTLLTRTIFDVASTDPTVKSFVDAYQAKYHEEPDAFAADGYDAFKVLEEALRQGGTGARDFWKGMRQVKIEGASGLIQFDEKGDVGQFPRVYQVADGKMIDYEKYVEIKKKELQERLDQLRREAEAARRSAQAGGS